jgi:hypothetical protein
MKVFWSWQSDSSPEINQDFIKSALEVAINAAADDLRLEDATRPELDYDTKGVAGAAEVVPVVFEKIAKSAVFVADVTLVAKTEAGRPHPNANVMIEIGWSLNAPGPKQQIYVFNLACGYEASQLPFDIRGRKVITYCLSPAAGEDTVNSVKVVLINRLIEALKLALAEHMKEVKPVAATGVPFGAGDPSQPIATLFGFRHRQSLGGDGWTEVEVLHLPRTYLRMIPVGWAHDVPDVATIGSLAPKLFPFAASHCRDSDFGPTDEGYVHYRILNSEPRRTSDITMYFEQTGEFWVSSSAHVVDRGSKKLIQLGNLFQDWSSTIRRCNQIFDQLGALASRRAEVGFAQFGSVLFPGWSTAPQQVMPRQPRLSVTQTMPTWTEEAHKAFLVQVLDEVSRLYGVQRRSNAAALEFVNQNDPQRPRG